MKQRLWADTQQLHSDRRKFGQQRFIDPRFQREMAAHQGLDPTGSIGRTLRCPNLDHGDLAKCATAAGADAKTSIQLANHFALGW